MNFLISPFQPVVGAAGIMFRVQLPTASRIGIFHPAIRSGRALLSTAPLDSRDHQRDGMALQRAQHRAQCRAACMSKANF